MENNGPIISRGDSPKDKLRRVLLIVVALFFIGIYSMYMFTINEQPDEFGKEADHSLPKIIEDVSEDVAYKTEENKIDKPIEVEVETAEFYYKKALAREEEKDFVGAVAHYTKVINLANKYSAEMWNALNNRGIIKAKQFKDYKGALADFNQIIETETNRIDGNMILTRLEAGYTNRAYLKKLKGDKDGACDDLYEALYLGVESSKDFIQQQIDKNCL
ncbi:MAG: hypothetical protein H6587_02205 [Flavobacteriales bacterium]|nr:hypothetical protein [Flavobacteriales bacterium]MCB9363358.1 hypothetical protein [Flavobacteriales bacterium]